MTGSTSSSNNHPKFYTHRDLASDYYQTIIAKGRPKWCKWIWLLLTLSLLGTTSYLIYKLIKEYLEYNSFNKISVKWEKSVTLPAITICSTNSINFTEFSEDVATENAVDNLKNILMIIGQYKGIGGIENAIDKTLVLDVNNALKNAENETVSIFDDYMFEPESFLLGDGEDHFHVKFAGVWKKLNVTSVEDPKTFVTTSGPDVQPHHFGKCIVLNDDQSMVQVLGGPSGGLTIDLNAQVDDYLPTTKTKGFMVYLRNPNETLLIDDGGILVSPGTETFISLSKSKVTRLPPKYGSCQNVTSPFAPTVSRSVRECIQDHKLHLAVKNCSCVPWYLRDKLMKLNNTNYTNYWYNMLKTSAGVAEEDVDNEQICGFATQSMCDVQVLEDLVGTIEGNGTVCPEPCSFNQYEWTINKGDFPPTEDYWSMMLKDSVVYEDEVKDKTFSFAKENYVRINIFYPDIKITEKTQEKAYEIFNFIAEFGGTVDMMISFSFFTVFQVVELIIVWMCLTGYRKLPGSESNHRSDGQHAVEKTGKKSDDEGGFSLGRISGVFA
ncbi:hypothetical protein ACHWQZ_G015051 [Mnemiopsis leidyi]